MYRIASGQPSGSLDIFFFYASVSDGYTNCNESRYVAVDIKMNHAIY